MAKMTLTESELSELVRCYWYWHECTSRDQRIYILLDTISRAIKKEFAIKTPSISDSKYHATI